MHWGFPCSDLVKRISVCGQCWHNVKTIENSHNIPTAFVGPALGAFARSMLCFQRGPVVWTAWEKFCPFCLALTDYSLAASTPSLMCLPKSHGWAPPGRRPAGYRGQGYTRHLGSCQIHCFSGPDPLLCGTAVAPIANSGFPNKSRKRSSAVPLLLGGPKAQRQQPQQYRRYCLFHSHHQKSPGESQVLWETPKLHPHHSATDFNLAPKYKKQNPEASLGSAWLIAQLAQPKLNKLVDMYTLWTCITLLH